MRLTAIQEPSAAVVTVIGSAVVPLGRTRITRTVAPAIPTSPASRTPSLLASWYTWPLSRAGAASAKSLLRLSSPPRSEMPVIVSELSTEPRVAPSTAPAAAPTLK